MKKKDLYGYIALLVVCGVGTLIALQRNKNLENNFLISTGSILYIDTSPKSVNLFVDYYFVVDGKTYENKSSVLCSKTKYYQFVNQILKGKSLPVIYEKGRPGNSEMLFLSKDYEKFKVPISKEYAPIVNKIDSIVNAK